MEYLIKRLDIINKMLEDYIFEDEEFEFLIETKQIIQDKIIRLVRLDYDIE